MVNVAWTEPHEVPDASGPANELSQDQELDEAKDEHRSKDAVTDDKDLNHTELLLKETQIVLQNKTQECKILDERLTNVLAEIGHLRTDLESTENLLTEAQVHYSCPTLSFFLSFFLYAFQNNIL